MDSMEAKSDGQLEETDPVMAGICISWTAFCDSGSGSYLFPFLFQFSDILLVGFTCSFLHCAAIIVYYQFEIWSR
ncbi:hypothetical protein SUGI_1025760 [Cryptomeria japonica]|nr:hypothetical protein SUGI_1025760 [Cryptomeria japonica]